MTVQLLFQWHVRQYAYSEVIHCSLSLCGDTFDPLPLLKLQTHQCLWENLALYNNQHNEDQGYAKITDWMTWHDTTIHSTRTTGGDNEDTYLPG